MTNQGERANPNRFGTVLMQCRSRRVFSALITALGFVFALLIGAFFLGLISDQQPGVAIRIVLGVFLLIALYMIVIGVNNTVRPPVLFEATNLGIVLRTDGQRQLDEEFLIPWKRVENMEYMVSKEMVHAELTNVKTIAVKVRTDGVWSPATHLKDAYNSEAKVIHLDAVTGTPHGTDLLQRLRSIQGAAATTPQ